jgi:hypothetical protein
MAAQTEAKAIFRDLKGTNPLMETIERTSIVISTLLVLVLFLFEIDSAIRQLEEDVLEGPQRVWSVVW